MDVKTGIRILAAVVLLGIPATVACGADDDTQTLKDQLRQMTERLESLEKQNTALQGEVAALKEESGEQWLTEQRAAQIRSLVSDVLADADQRASLQSSGMTAGWSDGFFLSSPDGRFLLRVSGLMQFRWMYNHADSVPAGDLTGRDISGFENSRTQLTFRGHVFDRSLTYMVRGNFSRTGGGSYSGELPRQSGEFSGGDFQLFDAWMRYAFNDEFSIRAGQFKLPFTRETLVYSANLLTVERSLIDFVTSMGYSQGVEAEYRSDWFGFMGAFSDGGTDNLAGPLGTNGPFLGTIAPNTSWLLREAEWAATARAEFLLAGNWEQFRQFTSPMGDPFGMMLGVAGTVQRGRTPAFLNQPLHPEFWGVTGDVSVAFGGASLFASVTYESVEYDSDTFNGWEIFGVVVQGSVYLASKWELFGRYEFGMMTGDDDAPDVDDLFLATIGLNWYIDGQDVKFTVDGGFGQQSIAASWSAIPAGYRALTPATNQFVVRTQFQLQF